MGHQLAQKLHALRRQFGCVRAYAGDVAAGPTEATHEAFADRLGTAEEYNRYRRGGGPCRPGGHSAPRGRDHRDLSTNEVVCQCGKAIVLTLRPAVFDGDVLTFDVAALLQTLVELGQELGKWTWRGAIEEAYNGRRRLRVGGWRAHHYDRKKSYET